MRGLELRFEDVECVMRGLTPLLGRVYPRVYSEAAGVGTPFMLQTECLLRSISDPATLDVRVRFLHPFKQERQDRQRPVASHAGEVPGLWQDGDEREIRLSSVWIREGRRCSVQRSFSFPASFQNEDTSQGGDAAGAITRRQEAIMGVVEVQSQTAGAGCMKISVRIMNQTPLPAALSRDPDSVLLRTFGCTHVILQAHDGAFLSSADPEECRELAETCENIGTWPVLVAGSDVSRKDIMLSSPLNVFDCARIVGSNGSSLDGERSRAGSVPDLRARLGSGN